MRDASYFLGRLRSVDHLPELEASHTAMTSTWDVSGGNNDGDIFKRIEVEWDAAGPALMEAEDMRWAATEGIATPFHMGGFGKDWSGDRILWWRKARPGARLRLEFPAPASGLFRVGAYFTMAPDYGMHELRLNGRPAGRVDLYHPEVIAKGPIVLGAFELKPAGNHLDVEVAGSHPDAQPGFMFGLDCLVFVGEGDAFPALDAIPPPRRACNVLLDVDGPGCLHRLFCGFLGDKRKTRIQIFLDHASRPLLDLPLMEFYDYESGPFPYPLVFHKSYPGLLFPIPYERHCRVQLVHPDYGKTGFDRGAWSNYWQAVFTTYPEGTPVKSLEWPMDGSMKEEVVRTCEAWLRAESMPFDPPERWSVEENRQLEPGSQCEIRCSGTGVIRQLRMTVEPPSAEVLSKLHLQIRWNGSEQASVDAPIGYLFGHAHCKGGLRAESRAAVMDRSFVFDSGPDRNRSYSSDFHSLLLSVTGNTAAMRFPMPFEQGAVLRFVNRSRERVTRLAVQADVEPLDALPEEWGFFHATWSEERAATDATPKFGPQNVPGKIVLDRRCRGKYVGVLLQVAWPHPVYWWGEGDWLIWADREGWPPDYHGTGSEEYFNSGWGCFDRKAVSGFVTLRPGHPTVYSFHLNDAFQFQRSIRVVEEQVGCEREAVEEIRSKHPVWRTTAFWYAAKPMPAESRPRPGSE